MLSFVLMFPDWVKKELESVLLAKEVWLVAKLPSFCVNELMREPPLI